MAVAKLKSEELVQRVGAILDSGNASEFELARLRAEAEKIAAADPVGYQIVRGFLAAIDGDVKKTKAAFENAIRLSPGNWQVYYNYSSALNRFGDFQEALALATRAHELDQGNSIALDKVILGFMLLGRFRDAQSWLSRRSKVFPDRPLPSSEIIRTASDFLTQRGIPDEPVEESFKCAHVLIKARKFHPRAIEVLVQQDEEAHWISFGLQIEASPAAVADVNEELAESIVQLGMTSDVLMAINVMFLPA